MTTEHPSPTAEALAEALKHWLAQIDHFREIGGNQADAYYHFVKGQDQAWDKTRAALAAFAASSAEDLGWDQTPHDDSVSADDVRGILKPDNHPEPAATTPPPDKAAYLGDGVYASFDGYPGGVPKPQPAEDEKGWRRIESAPTDKPSGFQVFCPTPYGDCIVTAYPDRGSWWIAFTGLDHSPIEVKPTHWRPLPLPPGSAAPPVRGELVDRETLMDVAASLAAAISLLERSPKKAAPSNKMFDQMLADYRKSLDRARKVLALADQETIHYHRTGNPIEREWSDKFGRHFKYTWQAPDGRIFSRIITSDPIVGWTVTWDECRKSVMDAAALASVKQASGEGGE